ncbi:hypothetical protein OUZ56_013834 [Daphnia magna]|uniref:Uncharacterized protein n=1 Tax=Daphnia magna TaxID=35525 RepID=A0ABQ9Z735_9CRUS|nr:hypothetical protein OUZ56_013834 [Daphnia magna]
MATLRAQDGKEDEKSGAKGVSFSRIVGAGVGSSRVPFFFLYLSSSVKAILKRCLLRNTVPTEGWWLIGKLFEAISNPLAFEFIGLGPDTYIGSPLCTWNNLVHQKQLVLVSDIGQHNHRRKERKDGKPMPTPQL